MQIAYVGGPYRSKYGLVGRLINIIRARQAAKALWKLGYAVICPHSNSAFFDKACSDKQFLQGDIEILRRCDLLVILSGWEYSRGTKDEIWQAITSKIPIYKWENGLKVIIV